MLVVHAVSVHSQHTGGCGEGERRALVPKPNAVLFHEERPERVADFVRVVCVRDVETHENELFHVHEGGDAELLEGAREEHVGEHDVRFQKKTVDRPPVQLEGSVRTPDPHRNVGGRGNGAEVSAVLLHVGPEAAEQVRERVSSVGDLCDCLQGDGCCCRGGG